MFSLYIFLYFFHRFAHPIIHLSAAKCRLSSECKVPTDPVYNVITERVERGIAYFSKKNSSHDWLMKTKSRARE